MELGFFSLMTPTLPDTELYLYVGTQNEL